MILKMFILKSPAESYLLFCVFLLLTIGGCSIPAAKSKTITHLIPENFEGGVVIVYAQKDGVTPVVTEDEIVFNIPADGILKVSIDAKTVRGNAKFFFAGKNGERTEIELLHNRVLEKSAGIRTSDDISADERDNKIFVMSAERGNFNTSNGVVMFSCFTVGKPKDGNLLVSRTHNKISQVQP